MHGSLTNAITFLHTTSRNDNIFQDLETRALTTKEQDIINQRVWPGVARNVLTEHIVQTTGPESLFQIALTLRMP